MTKTLIGEQTDMTDIAEQIARIVLFVSIALAYSKWGPQ